MKYRILQTDATTFYPQYRKFLRWKFFKPKFKSMVYNKSYHTREQAMEFLAEMVRRDERLAKYPVVYRYPDDC